MTIEEKYLTEFVTFEQGLNGQKELFIHDLRKEAIEAFQQLGFPTMKNEEWKYTNLSKLIKEDLIPFTPKHLTKEKVDIQPFLEIKANRLVFVNGFFSQEHSEIIDTKEGLQIGNLKQAISNHNRDVEKHLGQYASFENNSITALNTAFSQDGVFINIPDNYALEHPVVVEYISTESDKPQITQIRNLILVGKNSQAKIIEHYENRKENAFNNIVTEVLQAQDSHLQLYKLGSDNPSQSHLDSTYVAQQQNSHLYSCIVNLGGKLVRNNFIVDLNGEHSDGNIYGLSVVADNDHVDNHIIVNHNVPNCESNQLFKGLFDDHSTGVFNGKILVKQDAQKTNAFQSNKNILLSDTATINSKPQLEIFADDVKCSHGATSGQLDDTALFYLRSRGLSENQARSVLVRAFAEDIVEKIKLGALREYVSQLLSKRFELEN